MAALGVVYAQEDPPLADSFQLAICHVTEALQNFAYSLIVKVAVEFPSFSKAV